MTTPAEARKALESIPYWFHTIELAPTVVTPGFVDLRPSAPKLLPDDLSGKTALDVGAADGFWTFEMEKRGARVTAIDVPNLDDADWPPRSRQFIPEGYEHGQGFRIAAACLGSPARWIGCSLYDLTAERIGGCVDFAFIGALLIHLRDPITALQRVYDSMSPGGILVIREPISIWLSLRAPRRPVASFDAVWSDVNWWMPNAACVRSWLEAAGFVQIERLGFTRPPSLRRKRPVYVGMSGRRSTDEANQANAAK